MEGWDELEGKMTNVHGRHEGEKSGRWSERGEQKFFLCSSLSESQPCQLSKNCSSVKWGLEGSISRNVIYSVKSRKRC